MHNPHMMGMRRVDHFNMKGSMCVIALFGLITIVSYFNELNKAGLLRRGVIPRPLQHSHGSSRSERSVGYDTIIQKNGDLHHLGLEIVNIKNSVKHGHQNKKGQEINIKLHIGQNSSYEKINNSVVPIYNHKNTLPNFYSSLDISLYNISAFNLTDTTIQVNMSLNPLKILEERHKKYQKSVMVFAHQYEPHAYLLSDCLMNISRKHSMAINNLPINRNFRNQWDSMNKHKRNAFKMLYGGLTFGVCESISRPCSYFTVASHPLDRLAAIYDICTHKNTGVDVRQLCKLNNADRKLTSLKQFILDHGSSFFQKLVYYAKHCRLIGEDEICLQGFRTSFIFTPVEAEAHLNHILQHLETWFSAIVMVEHFQESLHMLQNIYGYEFPACYSNTNKSEWLRKVEKPAGLKNGKHVVLSHKERMTLLNNTNIKAALYADITIYNEMVKIFKRQMDNRRAVREFIPKYRRVLVQNKRVQRQQHFATKAAAKLAGDNVGKSRHGLLKPNQTVSSRKASNETHIKDLKHWNSTIKHLKHGNSTIKHLKHGNSTIKHLKHGNSTIKHLKHGNSTKADGTTAKGFIKSITRFIADKLDIPKQKPEHKILSVEGLDPMMYQNLSALELTKSHTEDVRPGMLEKSNAIYLRHLPNPGVTMTKKRRQKHNKIKNKLKMLEN